MDRIRILAVFLLPSVRRSAGRRKKGGRRVREKGKRPQSSSDRRGRTEDEREGEREAAAREKGERERAQVNERMASLPPSPCLFVLHLASKNSLRSPAASPSLPPSHCYPSSQLPPSLHQQLSFPPSAPRGLCKLLPLLLRREPESEGREMRASLSFSVA